MRRWLPAIALAVVVASALVVGTRGSHSSGPSARITKIESEVRCPQCEGQSVLASDAPTARAVRQLITTSVEAGRTDGQIEQDIVDRYGSDLLLRPSSSGITGLVWVIPLVAFAIAAAGLTLAFRRWRAAIRVRATDEDRALVGEALADGD
ncbi:MAG: cytochrome c-type biogenesis protein [Acidimicrobiales bacterium]